MFLLMPVCILSSTESSCSARSSTDIALNSSSPLSAITVLTILFASAIWLLRSPPLSATVSRPFSIISAMYLESTFEASALSIGAVEQSLSSALSIATPNSLFITCS